MASYGPNDCFGVIRIRVYNMDRLCCLSFFQWGHPLWKRDLCRLSPIHPLLQDNMTKPKPGHLRIPLTLSAKPGIIPKMIYRMVHPIMYSLLDPWVCAECKDFVIGSARLACGCTLCPSCMDECVDDLDGASVICILCNTVLASRPKEDVAGVERARADIQPLFNALGMKCAFCGLAMVGIASMYEHVMECPNGPCVCIQPGCGRIGQAHRPCDCTGNVDRYVEGLLGNLAGHRFVGHISAHLRAFGGEYVGASTHPSARDRFSAIQAVLLQLEPLQVQCPETRSEVDRVRRIVDGIQANEATPFTPFNVTALVRAVPTTWLPDPSTWDIHGDEAYRDSVVAMCGANCGSLCSRMGRPYQCTHTVCGLCESRLRVCPQCRAAPSASPVRWSSRLIAGLKLKCPCDRGPDEGIQLKHADTHVCASMYLCPFAGCAHKMGTSNRKVLDRHIRKQHTNRAVWTQYYRETLHVALVECGSDWVEHIDFEAFDKLVEQRLSLEIEEPLVIAVED